MDSSKLLRTQLSDGTETGIGDSSNKTKNKTRMERIPPTKTRIESKVREQGLNCLEQEWVQLALTKVRSNGPHSSIYTNLSLA